MHTTATLTSWLDAHLRTGPPFEADAEVLPRSYLDTDAPSILIRLKTTGWSVLLEQNPERLNAWRVVMETADVESVLSSSDLATLTQTLRTVYEMCDDLEQLDWRETDAARSDQP